ncbi:MAG: hypothetical protein KAJ40_06445 [Alphaproteobacteria bacterium]|nr:hypothetical protein [Alphaproteobacteria bacterium]
MKYPYLYVCLAFSVSVAAFQPMIHLDAAELWNAKKGATSSPAYTGNKDKSKSGSNGYYNVPKASTAANRSQLYNTKDPSRNYNSNAGGLQTVIQAYNDVEMGMQKTSKQFQTMSKQAVANRQADINHALQMEYETRKATAKHMIGVYKEAEASRIKGEKEHQLAIAAYKTEKEDKALERQRKKDIALGKITTLRGSSSEKTGLSYTAKSSSSSQSLGLKKPARLFNDPND